MARKNLAHVNAELMSTRRTYLRYLLRNHPFSGISGNYRGRSVAHARWITRHFRLRAVLYYTGLRDAAICGIRLRDLAGPQTLPDGRVVFGKLRTTGEDDKESVKAVHPELWTTLEKYVESRSREDRVCDRGRQPTNR